MSTDERLPYNAGSSFHSYEFGTEIITILGNYHERCLRLSHLHVIALL